MRWWLVHLLCFAAGATALVSLVGGEGSAAAAKRGAVFKRAAQVHETMRCNVTLCAV